MVQTKRKLRFGFFVNVDAVRGQRGYSCCVLPAWISMLGTAGMDVDAAVRGPAWMENQQLSQSMMHSSLQINSVEMPTKLCNESTKGKQANARAIGLHTLIAFRSWLKLIFF